MSVDGESVNLYGHYGNQGGRFSGRWELIHFKMQQYHSWIPYYKDTCTYIFVDVVFITDRNWKQTKCPPVDEWIVKM